MKKLILFLAALAAGFAQPVTQIGTGNVSGTLYFGGAPTGGNITGASGAVTVTAQGSNQNIQIIPSGTGALQLYSGGPTISWSSGSFWDFSAVAGEDINFIFGTGGNEVKFLPAAGASGQSIHSLRAWNNSASNQARFSAYTSRGTQAAALATLSGDDVGQLTFGGNKTATTASFNSSIRLRALATENYSSTAAGTRLMFATTQNTTTTPVDWLQLDQDGSFQVGFTRTIPAWGTTGPILRTATQTLTDSTSSGTVATAVANSFAAPTFAANSSSTFTNAANVYIAGDITAGTNVTLTNTYGLWNVGKTRLDGRVYIGTATGTNLLVGTATNSSNGSIQLADHTTSAGGIGFGAGNNSLYTSASGTLFWNGNKITAARAADTTQTITIDGGDGSGIYLTASGTKNFIITGAAGNMTITAGTGNSRTLTLQTTTSGGTATNAEVISATQQFRWPAYGAGALTTDASGNITASSDHRLKDMKGEFTRGLEAIRMITPIKYRWNAKAHWLEHQHTYAGFDARNVYAAIPEAIGRGADGYLTFADRPVTAALVNAVKELDARPAVDWWARGMAALALILAAGSLARRR